MNDITKDIKEWLEMLNKYKVKSQRPVVGNSKDCNLFQNCISNLANEIKNIDEYTNNYLLNITQNICYKSNSMNYKQEILFGVNACCLTMLKEIVDLIDSESFQRKLKVKKPKIFISHSSKDIKYIEIFVEMLKAKIFMIIYLTNLRNMTFT